MMGPKLLGSGSASEGYGDSGSPVGDFPVGERGMLERISSLGDSCIGLLLVPRGLLEPRLAVDMVLLLF
jgi:hypothetical protein